MNNLKEKLFNLIEKKESDMIDIRRHLHQHPELSFEEAQTAEYIKSFYEGKDVKVTQPLEKEHAIIVEIKGGQEGRTIGLRADFDALPITEEQMFLSNHKMKVLCMLVAMMLTLLI